ncbi:MAG: DUF481 domain-containing protein [Gammaproteobacteria bacterium]|nr:DUF481 domain-containing protein [Gammaproteobacteria bacterium]
MKLVVLFVIFALTSPVVLGDWSSEVEFGAVVTTGNTEQENFKLRALTESEGERMKHRAQIDALRSSEDDTVTAHNFYAFYQVDRKLDERQSLFARFAYTDDRFSGFDYQADVTAGYSRTLYQTDTMELVGDIGLGVRRSEFDTGATDTEFINRLAGEYTWQLTESSTFRQLLSTEIGDESTITRSETSLRSTVVGALAMKLALTVKHQSEVPAATEKTDTETSVTLVYSF